MKGLWITFNIYSIGGIGMSKERLEEIKREYKKDVYDCKLGRFDINWLIEQAERVQELEEAAETDGSAFYSLEKMFMDLEEQNKRYREAIGAIEDLYNQLNDNAEIVDGIMMVVRKTVKALEELK